MATKDLVLIALFAAFLAVLSLIQPLPLFAIPVPLTLQTLGVMLAGALLGPLRGLLACLLYLTLAAIGLPVLPGGRGGLGVFLGPTGGFLLGLAAGAYVTGLITQHWAAHMKGVGLRLAAYVTACLIGGMLVVFALGVPWLAFVTQMGLVKASLAMAVFVPGDLLKAVLAAWIAIRVEQVWPLLRA